jgi:hypothetical protein
VHHLQVQDERALFPASIGPSLLRDNKFVPSRQKQLQGWRRVRLVISDHQIDGRRLAFQRTADHGARQQILRIGGHQRQPAGGRNQRHRRRQIVHPKAEISSLSNFCTAKPT